jgi:hypothetical protein
MALQYPKENRIFTDKENTNHRLYRESEVHSRVNRDADFMREDMGFEKMIYQENFDVEQAN